MTLSRKLLFGFGAVILIVVALGAIAHLLFRQIGSNISVLSGRSLPVVKLASSIQRTVLETVAEERDYLLDQKEETRARVGEKLKALTSLLTELDSAAKQHNDSDLVSKTDQARKALGEHGALYNRTVEAIESNRKQELVMDEKGAVVDAEADAFMDDKKSEYQEATDSLALLNALNVASFDMRLREKSYTINPNKQQVSSVERTSVQALKQCDQLEKLARSETEKKQVGLVRVAIEEYLNAFRLYIKEHEIDSASPALLELAKGMDRAGDKTTQIIDDYILVKQSAVEKVAQAMFIIREINEAALEARICEKAFVITKDPKYWESLNQHIRKLTELYEKAKKTSSSAKDQQRLDRASQATKEYLAAAEAWMKTGRELQQTILPGMNENGKLVISTAQTIESDAWRNSDRASDLTQSAVSKSNLATSTALAVGILVGLILAWTISRSITRPINRVIEGLGSSAEQVSSAANQISSSSMQLAEGSSEQAASIEETSSSLEEMASMTRQNAANADQANKLVAQAGMIVGEANSSMSALTISMKEISRASEDTQKIVKTIDEIAFQTNLLALNAAVEAARAGEAGAGFAVVADEVRNLAMRAAEAAGNTAGLIEGTVKKVKQGSSIVDETNQKFQRVADAVIKSGELVGEIAAASQEQAQGIEQINRAVAEMDKVTQQNSANAEESASASNEMSSQADQLREFVGNLVALVGGNAGDGQRQMLALEGDTARPAIPAPDAARKTLSGSSYKAAKGNDLKPAGSGGSSKEIQPDQLIPFDGEDF
jgi:methyl-accepting chemotaxis protein